MIFRTSLDFEIEKYVTYSHGNTLAAAFPIHFVDVDKLMPISSVTHKFEGEIIQRKLNKSRVRKLADYLFDRVSQKKNWTLPPIMVALFADDLDSRVDFDFRSSSTTMQAGHTVAVIDGQHRVEAIRETMRRFRDLSRSEQKEMNTDPGYQCILVNVIHVWDASAMQQVFADVNGTMSKPTRSLNIYFDKENPFNASVVEVINGCEMIKNNIEFEKNVVSGKSEKLFTPALLAAAIRGLFPEKGKKDGLDPEEVKVAIEVFESLKWIWPCIDNSYKAETVREKYCSPHAVYIKGLMMAIRYFLDNGGQLKDYLVKQIPIRKDDKLLKHRCVLDGKILAGSENSILTCNAILNILDVPLSPWGESIEHKFQSYLSTL